MNYAIAVPTVKAGDSITYDNLDANIGRGQWHTITACVRRATAAPASPIHSPMDPSHSTPENSASVVLRRPIAPRGRYRPTSRRARTPTSVASIRSCAARSEWRAELDLVINTPGGTLPLDGVTVVSIEQAVAAPYATRQLADLGAG